MVDFSNFQSDLTNILSDATRKLTGTERLHKLLDGGSLGQNTPAGSNLTYPPSLGDSANLNGHYIQFRVLEVVGLTGGNNKAGKGKNVEGSGQIKNQAVSRSASQVTSSVLGFDNIQYAERESIRLYMQEQIRTTYGADWELGEVGLGTSMALDAGREMSNAKSLKDLIEMGDVFGEAFSAAFNKEKLTKAGLDVAQVLSSDAVGNTLAAKQRRIRNPHMEFLFKGVNTRQFNFEFRFNPWDEKEADISYNIIKAFKKNMHPSLNTVAGTGDESTLLGVFLQYPCVFEIKLFSHGKENTWMHKFSRCALANMEVDYTAAGTSAFLREKGNGSPPADTNITLQFVELDILTRESIEDGM